MTPSAQVLTQKETLFGEIVRLYDLTDDVVNVIGAASTDNRAEQLQLLAPLIQQSNNATDMLCRIVTDTEKVGAPMDDLKKAQIQKAFREIFMSMEKLLGRRAS